MYSYETEKASLFTDDGQRMFLKVRDRVKALLEESGAFKMFAPFKDMTYASWSGMACIDRLVELGEIVEITDDNVRGQDRVFIVKEGV
jgi:hypothetical protein